MLVRRFVLSTHLVCLGVLGLLAFLSSQSNLVAQESVPAPGAQAARSVVSSPGRRLSPEAIHVIPPAAEYGETFDGPIDLPLSRPISELEWDPNYEPSSDTLVKKIKGVIFRREIWALEFGFKPVRMIAVDLPNADGQLESKLVWYLLYYVRYRSGPLEPVRNKDQFGNEVFGQPAAGPGRAYQRFMPSFVLNCTALNKRYQSRFIPEAMSPIAEKERTGKPIYDEIAIQKAPIPLTTNLESHEVWGVATWTDIDPRTDFFAVEVRGLTNAQKSEVVDNQVVCKQKTLVLNFSRPGDTINEIEDKIRYGVPATADPIQQKAILSKYGLQERLDHYWIYR